MPTGLFDIKDRALVLIPEEIAAGEAQCRAENTHYVPQLGSDRVVPLSEFVASLHARWKRAAQTARMIDNMRAGYCSITPNGMPPDSGMTH